MEAKSSGKVFISYTRSDGDFARRLASDIESFGFRVWFDEWELRVGESLIEQVGEAIQECQWMVVVLSPAAMKSRWVLTELRSGLTREIGSKRVFVLPVLCQKVRLPPFLRDKFYADFTSSYEAGLALMKDRLIGTYRASAGDQWLLVRSPLPRTFRSTIYGDRVSELAGSYYDQVGCPGGNIREALSVFSHAIRHLGSASLLKGSELWFGRTGRLVLRRDEDQVSGDYDWHGVSLAGRVRGKLEGECLTFSWDWSMSSERGRGLFWTSVPNVLYGGWWMDYDFVDEDAVRRRRIAPPNRWEFVNVHGLFISPYEEEQDSL